MTIASNHAAPLITAEELLNNGPSGRCELIDGRIVHMSPSGWEYGRVVSKATILIGGFIEAHKLGESFGAETGFILKRNPDRVRAPDFAFVSSERIPATAATGFFEGAPDFLIEVNSPDDRASKVMAKIDEWIAVGAKSCWVIDPQARIVEIHRAGGAVIRYHDADEISDEPMLPRFRLKVSDLFD